MPIQIRKNNVIDHPQEISPDDTKKEWGKYGLSITRSLVHKHHDMIHEISVNHDLVTNYLDSHPEAFEKYKNDQSGELKYYDVLRLARAELKKTFEGIL